MGTGGASRSVGWFSGSGRDFIGSGGGGLAGLWERLVGPEVGLAIWGAKNSLAWVGEWEEHSPRASVNGWVFLVLGLPSKCLQVFDRVG